jgi:plastocyanin
MPLRTKSFTIAALALLPLTLLACGADPTEETLTQASAGSAPADASATAGAGAGATSDSGAGTASTADGTDTGTGGGTTESSSGTSGTGTGSGTTGIGGGTGTVGGDIGGGAAGDGGTTESTSQTGNNGSGANCAASATSGLTIAKVAYQPNMLQVAPCTRVIVTNNDNQQHSVSFRTGPSPVTGIDLIKPGEVKELIVGQAGTYTFQCDFHPVMKLTVTVQ